MVSHSPGQATKSVLPSGDAVIKTFPFDQVRRAFDYYEIGDEICLVIVRDNKVVISIRGD